MTHEEMVQASLHPREIVIQMQETSRQGNTITFKPTMSVPQAIAQELKDNSIDCIYPNSDQHWITVAFGGGPVASIVFDDDSMVINAIGPCPRISLSDPKSIETLIGLLKKHQAWVDEDIRQREERNRRICGDVDESE